MVIGAPVEDQVRPGAKVELIFVVGLVPKKTYNLALRAAAPRLRGYLAHFTVVRDGLERERLQQLVASLGTEKMFPSAAGLVMTKS